MTGKSKSEPGTNQTAFDEYAADYDSALARGISVSGEDKMYFARGRVDWTKKVLEKLGEKAQTILDFGCGTGTSTPLFLDWPGVKSVIGTDVSARSLDVAIATHASARTQFHLMKDYEPAGEVDLVFCNGVFHHIPLNERPDAMSYISRCLRPGGLFAMWENNPWNPGTRIVMRRIPFDRDAITLSPLYGRRMLKRAGFKLIRTDFRFYFPRILKWLRPLEVLGLKIPLGSQYLVLGQKT
jgi:SAM-dependent methyltransferase